jgi:hypothetical protein
MVSGKWYDVVKKTSGKGGRERHVGVGGRQRQRVSQSSTSERGR